MNQISAKELAQIEADFVPSNLAQAANNLELRLDNARRGCPMTVSRESDALVTCLHMNANTLAQVGKCFGSAMYSIAMNAAAYRNDDSRYDPSHPIAQLPSMLRQAAKANGELIQPLPETEESAAQ